MFSLTQLTSFVTVAEELHFGRAAERLRMTQPPLSRQIQLLENELGVRLFDRSNRSVKLTHVGRTFLTEARRLLRQAEQAALAAQQASVGEAGSIRIGFTAGGTYAALGSLLRTTRTALPQVEVVLREMVTTEQFEALSEGILDLGMVRPPITRPDLDSRVLVREPLIAALPTEHPLTEVAPPLSMAHFDHQLVIMYSPIESQYFYNLLISVFHSAGVTPVFSQYLSQIHSVLALVNDGWGISLVPAAAAQLQYQGVTFRPVDLPETNPVELHLAWRKSNDNPALAALLRAL